MTCARRARWSWLGNAAHAAMLALALASAAHAARRIEIYVTGVDRAIADNVRSYLTLGRYVQRDDLTDAQVRRLADRAVDEAADALRPFGYYPDGAQKGPTVDWMNSRRRSSGSN